MTKAPRISRHLLFPFVLVAASTPSFAFEGEHLAKDATITLDQARAAATGAQSGTILDQELERRNGGSGLRYSFDIKAGQVVHEVGIDAKTGATLRNSVEGRK